MAGILICNDSFFHIELLNMAKRLIISILEVIQSESLVMSAHLQI